MIELLSQRLRAARTKNDLVALRDAVAAELNSGSPAGVSDDDVARAGAQGSDALSSIVAESAAWRAMSALPALLPYLDGESADDFESALADLFADLRHLADLLGVDWGEAEYRGQGYHGEEAVASR
ncbi:MULTISPECIES: hypothetical protein [Rhodococcus]|jgi:hypothetical protein|uniref:hypothetical protein n=1 Tax=Rhodococcus TaxID=1827 RepID=UPI00110E80C0|nr:MULTISPECIES: hypothetical protein [Rhodococcus]MCF8786187.1 hypothetical protein [Rhodococcus ruber]UTM40233.1 hypothetical protein MX572_25340 [Rhodococcus pyridinivorans]